MSKISVKNDTLAKILDRYDKDKGQLISILQDVQAEYNYLPREAVEFVSSQLDVPLSQVYSVATFFKAFSLKPRGRHTVHVCMGTACHVRGAAQILQQMQNEMKISCGDTTEDGKFTLESVACVGACALGPLVVVDGEYAGQMTVNKVKPLLEKYD
ncbi:MAG: NADH-quinone oxidoreductase subunit NuoE [Dehalococcoidales bacterium]|jgi:NADH-quinone oxidoreductase subunit E|nr:NADH-quinone oxidoreductase subunit NuoE [Dehalococcoidales bacterium]MDD3264594.1 NADH-quinone oxidoreductase subunit NuoE [Dehalococcoidales bacterium]MDD4322236.1 NADH-quinone oxidoreductase subunit NuoE [Dehalococcoidales bacterium]MDD4793816.1 NADH-quinone oxidoreductase subunit NuoE [Dehalococcoidales bacterium]MDD5121934.1 NADH-quinone oxidoreductase subunit NuoE [Dehalococcoidales bacterium]